MRWPIPKTFLYLKYVMNKAIIGLMAVAAFITWIFDHTAGIVLVLATVIVAFSLKRKQKSKNQNSSTSDPAT